MGWLMGLITNLIAWVILAVCIFIRFLGAWLYGFPERKEK